MKHRTRHRAAARTFAVLLALCLAAPAFAAAPAGEPPLDEALLVAARQDVSAILRRHDEQGHFHGGGALGVIGNEGRRFRIRFLSMERMPDNALGYAVTGKTKVGDTIREFTGTVILTSGRFLPRAPENADRYGGDYAEGEVAGVLEARVHLTENPSQPGAGRIEGTLSCDVKRTTDGALVFDDAFLGADAYDNNRFIGRRVDPETGAAEPCNFGMFRVPREGLPADLEVDSGVGEFVPSEKLAADPNLGWTDFRDCLFGMRFPEKNPKTKAACEREKREWWR